MSTKSFLGLRTCIYSVSNLATAKAWYTQAFQTEPYFDEVFYVGFNIGGYELGLQPTDEANATTANVMTYWGVHDVKTAFQRLLALGATAHEEPQNVGGDIEVASVRDPWGNAIGIIYNPDFKADV